MSVVLITLASIAFSLMLYMRFTGQWKIFAHEYITYSYPTGHSVIVNMNDECDTRYHWNFRNDTCVKTTNQTGVNYES